MKLVKLLVAIAILIPAFSSTTIAADPEEMKLRRAGVLGIQATGLTGKSLDDLTADLEKAQSSGDGGAQAAALQSIRDFKSTEGLTIQQLIDARLAEHKAPTGKYSFISHNNDADDATVGKFYETLRAKTAAAPAATKEQLIGGKFLKAIKEEVEDGVISLPKGVTMDTADIDVQLLSIFKNTAINITKLAARVKRLEAELAAPRTAIGSRSTVIDNEDDGLSLFD